MKSILQFTLLASFILLVFSCQRPEKKQFSWLEGEWVQTNGEANFHEQWLRINDSLLTGRGFVIDNSDTLFSERLSLQTINGKTIYRVEMLTGRIADFKLTESSDDKMVFELPENDFPSRIIYSKKSDTELSVILEGNENGKEMNDELIFKKQ